MSDRGKFLIRTLVTATAVGLLAACGSSANNTSAESTPDDHVVSSADSTWPQAPEVVDASVTDNPDDVLPVMPVGDGEPGRGNSTQDIPRDPQGVAVPNFRSVIDLWQNPGEPGWYSVAVTELPHGAHISLHCMDEKSRPDAGFDSLTLKNYTGVPNYRNDKLCKSTTDGDHWILAAMIDPRLGGKVVRFESNRASWTGTDNPNPDVPAATLFLNTNTYGWNGEYGWYGVHVTGLPVPASLTLTCYDSTHSAGGFATFSAQATSADGRYENNNLCRSLEGGDHWVGVEIIGRSIGQTKRIEAHSFWPAQPSEPTPTPELSIDNWRDTPDELTWYVVLVRGLPPGTTATIRCIDEANPSGFHTETVTANQNATEYFKLRFCQSSNSGDHWVRADIVDPKSGTTHLESNHIQWDVPTQAPIVGETERSVDDTGTLDRPAPTADVPSDPAPAEDNATDDTPTVDPVDEPADDAPSVDTAEDPADDDAVTDQPEPDPEESPDPATSEFAPDTPADDPDHRAAA